MISTIEFIDQELQKVLYDTRKGKQKYMHVQSAYLHVGKVHPDKFDYPIFPDESGVTTAVKVGMYPYRTEPRVVMGKLVHELVLAEPVKSAKAS